MMSCRSAWCCALSTALFCGPAHATLFFSDGFDYADGQLTASTLGGNPGDDVSGGLWTAHSGDTFDDNVDVISGQAQVLNSGSEDVNRVAGATMDAGDVWYYGAVVTVNDQRAVSTDPLNQDYFIHFKDGTFGFRARTYIDDPSAGGDYTVGFSASSGGQTSAWASDLTFGEPVTIVASYAFDTGDSQLWVNPTDINSTSLTDSADAGTGINALALRQDFISPGVPNNEILVDIVAIGTSFDEVLATIPEPSSFMLLVIGIGMAFQRARLA